jgi:2,3-bisphosphoglycerate-independent phosphoglycerate mutase
MRPPGREGARVSAAVLVILDGASEPLGAGPTSLERAHTPALDALAAAGTLGRLRTVAPGLPAGSESAIPALLGWTPPAPVDRAAIEAAAHDIALAPDERAWRVDVFDRAGARAGGAAVARAAAELRARVSARRVHRLAGHRLLVVGSPPTELCASGWDMPTLTHTARLRAWPEGMVPPRVLGPDTVVIGARGSAVGIARLMGAATVVPPGATGDVDTDLFAKARAACDALAGGAARVVVHVGAPDEAAHRRERAAKVAAIERADRELIAPLAEALREAGATLRVCPDHGCDPRTGDHDHAPVPCLDWASAAGEDRRDDALPRTARARPAAAADRLTERAVAQLPPRTLQPAAAALLAEEAA